MLRRLGSARDYMDFITEINSNLNFSINKYRQIKDKMRHLLKAKANIDLICYSHTISYPTIITDYGNQVVLD